MGGNIWKEENRREAKRLSSFLNTQDQTEEAVRREDAKKIAGITITQNIVVLNAEAEKTAEVEKTEEKQSKPDIYCRLQTSYR